METQLKRYAITIRGKVQHIGYRSIIEGTAKRIDLKGYIFNDIDNSVKIVCEGSKKSVDNFLTTIKDFARADIESIEKKEIRDSFPLPHQFGRIATDEYYEFSRKFDIGLDYLDGIKADTGDMKGTLSNIDGTLGTFVAEQREHNQHMDKHNQRLEKILEKLAEK